MIFPLASSGDLSFLLFLLVYVRFVGGSEKEDAHAYAISISDVC